MQKFVLREGVDEQADGEPDGAEHGAVKAGLWGDGGAASCCRQGLVFADLDEVCCEADCGADAEGDIGQACDAFAPAVLLGKGDWDDGEEEEGHEPGEADPDAEGEDSGFSDEHVHGFDGGVVEGVFEGWGFEFGLAFVALVGGLVAEELCAFLHDCAAAGFLQEERDAEDEWDVG